MHWTFENFFILRLEMGRGRRASIAFGEVAKLSNPTDNSTDGEHVQRPVAPALPGRNFVRDLRRGSPAPGSPPSSPKDSRRGSVTPEYLRRGSTHPEPYGDLRRGSMAPIDPFQAFDMTARKIPVIRSGRQRYFFVFAAFQYPFARFQIVSMFNFFCLPS